MNQVIKHQWLDALRSGTYTQGVGWLRRDDRYCCHGVLSDLYVQAHEDTHWMVNPRGDWRLTRGSEGEPDTRLSYCLPSYTVYAWWADLPEGAMKDLACMNDDGRTFAEIAEWIESQL